MTGSKIAVRYRFEHGREWGTGHFVRLAEVVSEAARFAPSALAASAVGSTAGVSNGDVDLPGLPGDSTVRLRAIEVAGKPLLERSYDREGRLTRIDYYDGVPVQYDWDDRG